jgi:hypothetical protein
MAGQPTFTGTAKDAVTLHRQATDLLVRLLADREAVDRRLTEAGRRDPIRSVTGASALENAISTTREMIARMDRLLQELHGDLQAMTAAPVEAGADRPRALLPSASLARRRTYGIPSPRQRPVAATA